MIKETEIRSLIKSQLAEKSLFLVDLSISASNKIKIEVDSINGASIKDCVDLSRLIESSLDRETEDFELEVSTPGLDSNIKVPEQFIKTINKDVEIVKVNGEKIKGKLISYNTNRVDIETKKKILPEGKKKKIEISEITEHLLTDIKTIKQQISFK